MEALSVFSSTSYPSQPVDPEANQARDERETEYQLRDREPLPLEGKPQFIGEGTARRWTLRLPVRMERVVVEKQVVVVEEVALRVRQVEEVQHFEGMLARERLRVDVPPDLQVTPRPEDRTYPGDPPGRFR